MPNQMISDIVERFEDYLARVDVPDRVLFEARDTILALRLRVVRLEETLRNVANAYGDQTWGTVTAMERALSEARAVLQQAPTTK